MDLRECVEYGAGRLLKLNGASHFERASQDLFGAFEITELHEDLPERRQRDGKTMARTE